MAETIYYDDLDFSDWEISSNEDTHNSCRELSFLSTDISTKDNEIFRNKEGNSLQDSAIDTKYKEVSPTDVFIFCRTQHTDCETMIISSQDTFDSQVMLLDSQESSYSQMLTSSQETCDSQRMLTSSQESSGSQKMLTSSQESSGCQKMLTSSQETCDSQRMLTSSQESFISEKMIISSQESYSNQTMFTSSQKSNKMPSLSQENLQKIAEKEMCETSTMKKMSSLCLSKSKQLTGDETKQHEYLKFREIAEIKKMENSSSKTKNLLQASYGRCDKIVKDKNIQKNLDVKKRKSARKKRHILTRFQMGDNVKYFLKNCYKNHDT